MKKQLITNLDKIIHKMNYVVNESPRYKSVMDGDEDYDNLPDELYEESNEEGSEAQKGLKPDVPSVTDVNELPPDQPEQVNQPEQVPQEIATPSPDVNDLQNEIIKSNIAAMRSIHDQMESLSNFVNQINGKLDVLNTDVEEVREPTNSEKLMSKSKVSYPYYFNLNDFWSDSWFNRNNQDNGIKELEDGTFAANFDDLPESDNIKDSFNRLT